MNVFGGFYEIRQNKRKIRPKQRITIRKSDFLAIYNLYIRKYFNFFSYLID